MTSSHSVIKFSYLFYFFPFIGYVSSNTINTSNSKSTCIGGGRITPGWTFPTGDISLQVGSPLEIHCSLNLDHSESKGYSAKDIVFRKGDEKVDSKYVTVINETTARLYVDNLTRDDSNEYYYCSLVVRGSESRPKSLPILAPQTYPPCSKAPRRSKDPPELSIGSNYVTLNTKEPKGLRNFTCYNLNWQTLKCTWAEPKNEVETNYSIFYQIPRKIQRSNKLQYECAIRERTSCTWTTSTLPRYRPFFNYLYFQIKGVNEFGELSQTFKFNNFQNVVPAAPTEIVAVGKTTHSIELQWNIGMWTIFNMDMDFMVRFASDSTNQDWIVRRYQGSDTQRLNDTVRVNVTGLNYPNMEFQFKVYMKSPLADEDCWSEPATGVFKTAPCTPEVAPQSDMSAFEVYSESVDRRDVLVYWKQILPEGHKGDDYDLKITVWEDSVNWRNLKPGFVSCSYANFTNLSFNSYEFIVRLVSRKGSPTYSSTIYLPKRREILPRPEVFAKKDLGESAYHLTWKLTNTPDIDKITDVTLLWCESNRDYSHPCASPFNWTYLSPETLEYNFKGNPDVAGYQFAISVNSRKSSSGLSWATCDLAPNQLNKIKYVWTDEVGSTFISLKWKLECSESAHGIKGYNVTYCPVKQTNLQVCAELEKTLVVYGNGNVDYATIVDLRPSTTYKISAFAFTDTLIGPSSVDIWSYTRDEAFGDANKGAELTSNDSSTESVWDMMEKKVRTLRSLSNEIICENFLNLCSKNSNEVDVSRSTN